MTMRMIPDVVNNPVVYTLSPKDTVQHAVEVMTEKSAGALVILAEDGARMVGIFSERDLMTRVVAVGKSPEATFLKDVMTSEVITADPDMTAKQALNLMREHHCRHLPVVQNDKVLAMVSVRDLYGAVLAEMQDDIQQKENFIFNTYAVS